MDRKSIIIIVVCFALIILWPKLMQTWYPPQPAPAVDQLSGATNQAALAKPPGIVPADPASKPAPAIATDAPEELLSVTNHNAVYTFSSHGGGLKLVELKDHKEAIECGRNIPGERRPATLNTRAPAPVLAVLGGETIQGNNGFALSRTESSVRAEKDLDNGLRIIKEFEIGTNYLLKARVSLENRSRGPLTLPQQEVVLGTSTPIGTYDTGMDMGVFWYNGSKAEHIDSGWFANRTLGCFPGTPRTEYVTPQINSTNVQWAAVHNQFFTIAAVPNDPVPKMVSRQVELKNTDELLKLNPSAVTNGFQTALVYPETVLQEGVAVERQFTIYAGPKEYNTLARLGAQFNNNLDAVMNFGGFFGWFAQALLLFMNWLHSLGLTYGLAIIATTVVIKLVFWPLTQASTKSMKRMQALQPQMKSIQEKYKDDPKKMNMKLMEFMREHKVSPLGGCLPLLLQIPIFFGFYQMLRSAIELRGESFLWACDLSQADTVAFIGGFPVNPLPLIMGVTMLWQARLTPVSPGVDPVQQKMMKYMPLMFIFILYNMQAGLTLYWTVQNLLTILQMKLTKTSDDAGASAPASVKKTPTSSPSAKKKK